MNFERALNYSKRVPLLTPDVLFGAILIREWSDVRERALSVKAVRATLEHLKLLSDAKTKLVTSTIQEYQENLKVSVNEDFATKCRARCDMIADDLKALMDLFDQLSSLMQEGKTICKSYNTCVFGCFLSHCLITYRQLTFTQVMTLQKEFHRFITEDKMNQTCRDKSSQSELKTLNFSDKINNLSLTGASGADKSPSYTSELLSIVSLYHSNGYHGEAQEYLRTCVQLAQDEKIKYSTLKSLSWLVELSDCERDKQVHLQVLVAMTTLKEQIEPLIAGIHSWGLLKLAIGKLEQNDLPTEVLEAILIGAKAAAGSEIPIKEKMSAFPIQAGFWDRIGMRPVGSLYANLQCHMMSCDILKRGQSSDGNHKPTCCQGDDAHCRGNSNGLAHSLVYLAMRFADEGRNGEAGQLLRYSQRAFAPNSKALQVLLCGLGELEMRQFIISEDVKAAEETLKNISVFMEQDDISYWTLSVKKMKGCSSNLVLEIEEFLHKMKSVKGSDVVRVLRYKLLLSEIYLHMNDLANGMRVTMETISLSREYHFLGFEVQAKLLFADFQIRAGCHGEAFRLLTEECVLNLLSYGSVYDQSKAWLLLSQAVFMRELSLAGNDTQAVAMASSHLNEALLGFRRCGARKDLRNSLLLLANFHKLLGNTVDLDNILLELNGLNA